MAILYLDINTFYFFKIFLDCLLPIALAINIIRKNGMLKNDYSFMLISLLLPENKNEKNIKFLLINLVFF